MSHDDRSGAGPTRKIDKPRPVRNTGATPQDEHTRLLRPSSRPAETVEPNDQNTKTTTDEQTRLLRPSSRPTGTAEPNDQNVKTPSIVPARGEDDPTVGWLVVIKGPGRGAALTLGYGMNSIGRAEDERVRLDFGDAMISRKNHAAVTYEPRGRKFYVQQGGGANLAYIGDTAVLQPTELNGGEVLGLGETELRFVPFCGPDFDWQDQ
jgi:hypothetical protein